MNVKTIVTIALIGLLGVGTAAGIFLSDRSQQQEPPSADIQQEEKEEAPVESSSQKEEEQEQSSQNSSSWRRNLPRRRKNTTCCLPMPKTRCRRTGASRLKRSRTAMRWTGGQRLPCGR